MSLPENSQYQHSCYPVILLIDSRIYGRESKDNDDASLYQL